MTSLFTRLRTSVRYARKCLVLNNFKDNSVIEQTSTYTKLALNKIADDMAKYIDKVE